MTPIVWTIVVVAAGLAMAFWGMHGVWNVIRNHESGSFIENVPLTPLQKRSWLILGAGLVVAVPILFILAVPGFPIIENSPALRVIMEILLVAGLMVYLMVLMNGLVRPGKDRVVIDERDRAILYRAPAVQARAMMVSIAAWTIILTEAYWETGQVPVVFMALVFWSCLVVAMMALPIGVLFGYWRN